MSRIERSYENFKIFDFLKIPKKSPISKVSQYFGCDESRAGQGLARETKCSGDMGFLS